MIAQCAISRQNVDRKMLLNLKYDRMSFFLFPYFISLFVIFIFRIQKHFIFSQRKMVLLPLPLFQIEIKCKKKKTTEQISCKPISFCWNVLVIKADFFDYSPPTQNHLHFTSIYFPNKIDDKCKRIEIQWWENEFICCFFFSISYFIFNNKQKKQEQDEIIS